MIVNRPAVAVGAGDEIIEMDRMRKMIAENMVMSKHVAPHVTSYVEADVTNLVMWRDKAKKELKNAMVKNWLLPPYLLRLWPRPLKISP